MIIKKRHLIIAGAILFTIVFFIKHYNILGYSEIDISFKLDNLNNDISFEKTELILSRIEKPWYYTQMSMKIVEASPNQDGFISFKLKKSKTYEVDIYTDKRETFCGGILFDADTLNQNQVLFIPIKRIKKIKLD